jgi:hypothetical protein
VFGEMITGKSSWSYTNDFPAVQLGITDYSKAKQTAHMLPIPLVKDISILQHNMALTVY